MRIWRFHNPAYHPLASSGAYTYGGRWNAPGVPVIYGSQTFAGGLLELLAHTSVPCHAPRGHVATLLEVPEDAGIVSLEPPYPSGWDHPHDYRLARTLIEQWLRDQADLCLLVPSDPGAPVERNAIINARHPRFDEVEVIERVGPVFDARTWDQT